MLGSYFYNQRIRKAVSVFGALFNNINVVRQDAAGDIISQVKVPLSYAPKRDFLARLDAMEKGEEAERQIAVKLPRMSFEIVGMNYDPSRQLPKMNKCISYPDNFTDKAQTVYTPVPYIIAFDLSIYAKSQDDALQIVEQILPYFTPQYTVTVKPLDDFDIKEDTPIALTSITFSDDYEALLEARRTIIYTLSFEMKLSLYKGVDTSSSVITDANIGLYEMDKTTPLSTITLGAFESEGLSGKGSEDGGPISNNNFRIKYVPTKVDSLEIVRAPSNGTATATLSSNTNTVEGRLIVNGAWSYTPNSDWHGTDTFTIRANFSEGGGIETPITVVVSPSTQDALDDTATLDLGLGFDYINVTVSTNDTFESEQVKYSIAAGGYPSNGSLSVVNTDTGEFRYSPNAGFTGTDIFTYRATPLNGKAEIGKVTITVIE